MESQILYMGTSKAVEIRKATTLMYDYGGKSGWKTFKSPKTSKTPTKVKYVKSKLNKFVGGTATTKIVDIPTDKDTKILGTTMPKTATRDVEGVSRTVNVGYVVRGGTKYSAIKGTTKKMKKSTYTQTNPYQYQLRYKDKVVKSEKYSTYENMKTIIFFADHYFDTSGEEVATKAHLPHPQECSIQYSDIRRNLDTSNTNNNDGRDNSGKYVLSTVRANVVTLILAWNGLSEDDGEVILQVLNPTVDTNGNYNYITIQYMDPATGQAKNGTFFANSERTVTKYANGYFKEIRVTLMEA